MVATGSGAPSDTISGLKKFSFSELKAATDNFSDENKLGHGGSGVVFKGTLCNGLVVAVKEFHHTISEDTFMNEVFNIGAKLQHEQIAKTLGYCIDIVEVSTLHDGRPVKEIKYCRMSVSEYLPSGSLEDMISAGTQRIDWLSRYEIIKEIAQGLHHLHNQHIVHLDLKPANILFDANMVPKIADFGLSRIFENRPRGQVTKQIPSDLRGTVGYMPPEYIGQGTMSEKNDVFSFGMVLLRIITSAKAESKDSQYYGPDKWAELLKEGGRMKELFDPTLVEESQLMDVERCLKVGLLCTEFDPADRPTMADALEMLNGDKKLPAKRRETLNTQPIRCSKQ